MPRKGFTLLELVVVVSIMVVVGAAVVVDFSGSSQEADLNSATRQIGTLLRQAQSDSLSEKQGARWGVHFDNTNPNTPFYSLFYTRNGSYLSGNEVGHYALPSDMCYDSSTVPTGGTLNVIFSAVSGATTSTSVTLNLNGCGTAVITPGNPTISETQGGQIYSDDFSGYTL
ncbi:MAG TPA: prepilin-type N-terminal cleavage/methylation domain-containing protein [Candidatus Paceibacterota bacterium]|nr:prepilin-type N-terminal cleavage/methylation domain-containing protein [Candidatus Paceibacterota bacterium]